MPKISQLPAATSVGATDLFAIVQSSTTKKATASLVLDYMQSGLIVTNSNFSGQLSLAHGGTNKNLTASNGAVVWCDADSFELTAIGAVGQILKSNGAAAPTWVTASFPASVTINDLLWSSDGTTVSSLATAASSILRTNSSGVPAWSGAMTNGQILIGSTGATPVAATITGTAGVSVTNGAGSITISGSGSGIGWNNVTGTSASMAADSGYVANNAGLVTLTLPATAAFGTALSVVGLGAGGWTIAQNVGQSIIIGNVTSTVGVGGSVASSNQYDSLNLICVVANTTWAATGGPQGALTIV